MNVVLRQQARAIFEAAISAADPADAVRHYLQQSDYSPYKNIWVVGAGKASATMAQAAESILGPRIHGGVINTKDGHLAHLHTVELNECSHPIPDQRGLHGAQRIADIVAQAAPEDLILVLLSGGASALLPMPAPPITLAEKQATTSLLLASGADIHSINTIRKHLSAIKGGQLARMAARTPIETLILSDVIGNDLEVIGSGPTTPDSSTFADALAILARYQLTQRIPQAVRQHLQRGAAGELPETPKPGDPLFHRVRNTIVLDNRIALESAAHQARAFGFDTHVLSATVQGETRDAARAMAQHARTCIPPTCLISGGETTVTLKGPGLGGRNQEFVLAAAIEVSGLNNIVILSAGTDGTDGPTDAAGAIADGQTFARNPHAQLYLDSNDSYPYFHSLGDLVKTGPTGTNVMDIHIFLIGLPETKGEDASALA